MVLDFGNNFEKENEKPSETIEMKVEDLVWITEQLESIEEDAESIATESYNCRKEINKMIPKGWREKKVEDVKRIIKEIQDDPKAMEEIKKWMDGWKNEN